MVQNIKRRLSPWYIRQHRLVADTVEPLHVPLHELGPTQCHWPYGEGPYTFCGREKEVERVYCAAHQALARRPGFVI